ncbi:MAG: chromosomal replication initiator protein DnaA [Candidatus Gastranaerophilales bacterium]|nr:chromosomal replication initiator protein DnaA [Candidatus Gastranaerophilales bacterium]
MKEINKEKIWYQVLQKLVDELEHPAFESWIKPVKLVSVEDNDFIVSVNSTLSKEYIYKNYSPLINRILNEVTGKNFQLKIIISKTKEIEEPKEEQKIIPLSEFQINALRSTSNNLNLKYTFETFVIGAHSKFCHAAALAVAKFPAKAHNPLFIYGGVGLGKTHLMQAVGHYILANSPDKKIKYTSTEMFTNDLINSIRNDKMSMFRQKYRQIDVLLLDDIQFIEGKEITQEEIFHTFNTLYESGKQVVLTSDRHPKNISTLTERLRSRFEWGLLADMGVPDIETRIAILRNKVERDKMNVPEDILELIATAYQNNIRELEGALNRVVAYVSINDCPMTVEIVKNIINFSGSGSSLTIDKIIETAAGYFALESSDLKGQSRSREVSQARQVAIYLARDMTNSSFPTIGDAFGGRKHTTILYSFEKMKEELQINKKLSEIISEISKRITSNCLN